MVKEGEVDMWVEVHVNALACVDVYHIACIIGDKWQSTYREDVVDVNALENNAVEIRGWQT